MQRQVAHALLTRPPLSCFNASRRINQNNSVRLECVMHAASVHPEPGSNSRINCIKIITVRWCSNLRAFFLSFFLLLFELYFSQNFSRFFRTILFFALYFFNLLLFNFQWPISRAPRSCGQLCYYITCLSLLSIPFSNFFQLFFDFLLVDIVVLRLRRRLFIQAFL